MSQAEDSLKMFLRPYFNTNLHEYARHLLALIFPPFQIAQEESRTERRRHTAKKYALSKASSALSLSARISEAAGEKWRNCKFHSTHKTCWDLLCSTERFLRGSCEILSLQISEHATHVIVWVDLIWTRERQKEEDFTSAMRYSMYIQNRRQYH